MLPIFIHIVSIFYMTVPGAYPMGKYFLKTHTALVLDIPLGGTLHYLHEIWCYLGYYRRISKPGEIMDIVIVKITINSNLEP